jgi:hypothetical protein
MGPRTPKGTGIRLHRQVWLKRSPQSLSPATSRPSCCGSSLLSAPRRPPKVAIVKTGRINYTTLEDVPEGEHVLASMFSLNRHPIVVLFDSSATHNFISMACTESRQLTITHLSTPYMISTPGGKTVTQYLAKNTLSI